MQPASRANLTCSCRRDSEVFLQVAGLGKFFASAWARKPIWWTELGWDVCRTKLARNIFFEARSFSRKNARNSPQEFEPLFCGSDNPAEFPPNFPQTFPPKNQKKNHRRASAGVATLRQSRGHCKWLGSETYLKDRMKLYRHLPYRCDMQSLISML